MNIWLVNHFAVPPSLPGGTRHFEMAEIMSKAGADVTIFASNVSLQTRRKVRAVKSGPCVVEYIDGIRFVWVNTCVYRDNSWQRAASMLLFAVNLWRAMRQISADGSPNCLYASSPHPLVFVPAALFARIRQIGFFAEFRDLWPRALVEMGVSAWHPFVLVCGGLERLACRLARAVIVLARGSRDYLLAKYGLRPDDVLVAPNGVEAERFAVPEERERLRDHFGFHKFTLVYVGAHGPANNLAILIEAASLLRDGDVEFVLVGDGVEKAKLVQLAENSGCCSVRFMDPVPKTEVPKLMKAADVGIVSLRGDVDCFADAVSPNKLFDYAAAKLPVLYVGPGRGATVVTQEGMGLAADPENAEAVAKVVWEMRNAGQEKLVLMGEKGQAWVKANHSRKATVESIIHFIRERA